MLALKLIKGDPYGKDNYSAYDFQRIEPSPALAKAIEEELALWEFHIERVEVYDHDEYGKERSVSQGTPIPATADGVIPVVWEAQLVAVKRGEALFFIPGGKGIGKLSETLWSESSSRSERYEVETVSIVKLAASKDPVSYRKYEGNPYYSVVGVDPMATEVVLHDGTVKITSDAFDNATALLSLSIPASVKEIGNAAFSGCDKLQSITVDGENPVFKSLGGCLINSQKGVLIAGTAGAQIPAGEGIKVIAMSAFSGVKTRHIAIPEGVRKIEWAAFTHADIGSIVLPKTLKEIESFAFEYGELGAVYFTGTQEDWEGIRIVIRNALLHAAPRYYYAEEKPEGEGRFWHYGENGEIIVW